MLTSVMSSPRVKTAQPSRTRKSAAGPPAYCHCANAFQYMSFLGPLSGMVQRLRRGARPRMSPRH
jgi:hypothetical protein